MCCELVEQLGSFSASSLISKHAAAVYMTIMGSIAIYIWDYIYIYPPMQQVHLISAFWIVKKKVTCHI